MFIAPERHSVICRRTVSGSGHQCSVVCPPIAKGRTERLGQISVGNLWRSGATRHGQFDSPDRRSVFRRYDEVFSPGKRRLICLRWFRICRLTISFSEVGSTVPGSALCLSFTSSCIRSRMKPKSSACGVIMTRWIASSLCSAASNTTFSDLIAEVAPYNTPPMMLPPSEQLRRLLRVASVSGFTSIDVNS